MKEQLQPILGIPYNKLQGPLRSDVLIETFPPTETNCQRALQIFYGEVFDIFLPDAMCLSYEGFWYYGRTISDNPSPTDHIKLGDVIYAAPRTSRKQHPYPEKEYTYHIGVLIPNFEGEPEVYHAISKEGTACWSWKKFCTHYEPKRVKRLLHSKAA